MGKVHRRLKSGDALLDLDQTLLAGFCLPFPIIQLLSNCSRPTALFKHKSPRSDWVVHAHFGQFQPGVVELPGCPRHGMCAPGTITAVMARYMSHGFPPVAGERFLLTQVFNTALVNHARYTPLPVEASSIDAVTSAAAIHDKAMDALYQLDHFIYRWQERRTPVHYCSGCWNP